MKESFGKRPVLILIAAIIITIILTTLARSQQDFNAGEADTITLGDGTYCFMRTQTITPESSYASEERIQITLNGDTVTGEKQGTQSGPDMNNGYVGSLEGVYKDGVIKLTFSYMIEGSDGKEVEEYKMDGTNLVKLRRPLIEQGGMLVPDTTKDITLISYEPITCEEGSSSAKIPAGYIDTMKAKISATWQSLDDEKSKIAYLEDGTFQSIYDGEIVDKGNWEIVTSLTGTLYKPVRSDALYLKEVSLSSGEEFYHEISLTEDGKNLDLMYMDRGNINRYERVE